MTKTELNLQPLQELLKTEVDLDSLVRHLDKAYYYFSQYSMKISCTESMPIDNDEVACLYWIERLKLMFEEMEN